MSEYRSHTDIVSPWLVKGWFLGSQNSEPSIICLKVNGNTILEAKANIIRSGLKDKKLHHSGLCGFQFYPADTYTFKDGDKIELYSNSINKVIHQSVYKKAKISQEAKAPSQLKTLIVGLGKSGTTAITYKLAEAMDKPAINFEPGKNKGLLDIELHKSLVQQTPVITKSLYGSGLDINFGRISQIYDKKIWIIRDPRDQLISIMLYRWFKGHNPDKDRFLKALSLVEQKEKKASDVSILDIWSCAANLKHLKESQTKQYKRIGHILSNLGSDWHVFKYSDMIDENFSALEAYLDLKISDSDIRIPDKFQRVVRSKAYGNWRNWFTKKDIDFFKPAYQNILEQCGFEQDWALESDPILDSEKGSAYMKSLFYGKKTV